MAKKGAKTEVNSMSDMKYSVYVIQILIVIVLSYLGIVAGGQVAQGVSLFYWAYPFFVLFTLYWGIWGIAGAYLGSVIGGGIFIGLPVHVSVIYGLGDLIAALMIYLVYNSKMLKTHGVSKYGDDIFKSKAAAAWFISWIVVVTNILGGLVGVTALLELGEVTSTTYLIALAAWVIGDALLLIILPALSEWLTPIMMKNGLIDSAEVM
jgi:hypothetical protein